MQQTRVPSPGDSLSSAQPGTRECKKHSSCPLQPVPMRGGLAPCHCPLGRRDIEANLGLAKEIQPEKIGMESAWAPGMKKCVMEAWGMLSELSGSLHPLPSENHLVAQLLWPPLVCSGPSTSFRIWQWFRDASQPLLVCLRGHMNWETGEDCVWLLPQQMPWARRCCRPWDPAESKTRVVPAFKELTS